MTDLTKDKIQEFKERRHSTIMFADISGFTSMSEKMDVEVVTELMNECFEMMGSTIKNYGGTIDKFIGDCVMALFGVPMAIEYAAINSIKCAIEIRRKIYEFNREKRTTIPLDIHFGINSGQVLVGYIGSKTKKEFTVMGDVVNIASRLQHMAKKGQILVGEETYKSTSEHFQFNPLGLMAIKGKKEKVPIYNLLSNEIQLPASQLKIGRKIRSKMVGREHVIEELKLILEKLVSGNGLILNVIGEPGIGKSRLISELRTLDDINKVTYLQGSGTTIGENLSYHAIIDIIQIWAKIVDNDTTDLIVQKLESAIRKVHPDGIDEILPFIATLMGIELSGKYASRIAGIEGKRLEKLILKSVKELIATAAEIRPLAFVVEDVQWCDQSTIQLLESLFRLVEEHPILFINVFRPNYKETSEKLLKTIQTKYPGLHKEIFLKPLEEKKAELLVRNLLKAASLPSGVAIAINHRAEGNPLFIEEVIRLLLDANVIKSNEGIFRVTENVNSVDIPSSVQEVFMVRLDSLDKRTRSLLKEASVIGRNFFSKILMEICTNPDEMNQQLDFLMDVQFIGQRIRLREIEYFFRHVLAQEVAYDSILIKERQILHLRVAKAIETVFHNRINEFYGVLAFHYGRGNNLEKAEEYLLKAGEEALKSAGSNEALRYFQEGLRVYLSKSKGKENQAKIAKIEKNIALALYNKGQMAEALTYFDKVLKYEGVRKPKNKLLAFTKLLGNILNVLVNLYLPRGKIKAPSKKDEEIAQLYYYKGFSMFAVGSPEVFSHGIEAIKLLNKIDIRQIKKGTTIYAGSSVLFSVTGLSFTLSGRILKYARENLNTKDIHSVLTYRYYQLVHNYASGNWGNEACDWDLVESTLKLGDLTDISGYLFWQGLINSHQGNFTEATRCVQKLHEIGETYENDYTRVRKHFLNAFLLLKSRKLDDLLLEIDDHISYIIRVGQQPYALGPIGVKAYAQILNNDFKGAEKTFSLADEIISQHSRILPLFLFNYHLSKLFYSYSLFEQQTKENYEKNLSGYIKVIKKSGHEANITARRFAPIKAETLFFWGNYYWIRGHQKKAIKIWGKSINKAKQLGAKTDLVNIYMQVGNRIIDSEHTILRVNNLTGTQCIIKAENLLKELDFV